MNQELLSQEYGCYKLHHTIAIFHIIFLKKHKKKSIGSIPGMVRFFSSLQHPDWLWGPPSIPSNGYWGNFPQVKVAGCQPDHSTLPSTEAENGGAISSVPISFHGAVLN
jgi:hypothetical protein